MADLRYGVKVDSSGARQGARQVEREFHRIGASVRGANRDINTFTNSFRRFTGLLASGFGIGALIRGLRSVFSEFGRFERQLATIQGLVGISRRQLNEWSDDLKRIGRESGQSLNQLAQGLYFITSAGLRGRVAMQVLEQSAKAATAGLGELADVAKSITTAVNAYGSENLSAAEAVNVLTEAVRLGAFEADALATTLGRAVPLASGLGIEFKELTGILAAMSRTGTSVPEAVTQINTVLLGLLKPTDRARRAAKELGLSFVDLRKSVREDGLFNVLQDLRRAFGGNLDEMNRLFPRLRATRGIFDLLGANYQENRKLLDEMTESVGVLNEAFDATSETLTFKWATALARVKEALIEFGEEVSPHAIQGIERFNNSLDNTIFDDEGIRTYKLGLNELLELLTSDRWARALGVPESAIDSFTLNRIDYLLKQREKLEAALDRAQDPFRSSFGRIEDFKRRLVAVNREINELSATNVTEGGLDQAANAALQRQLTINEAIAEAEAERTKQAEIEAEKRRRILADELQARKEFESELLKSQLRLEQEEAERNSIRFLEQRKNAVEEAAEAQRQFNAELEANLRIFEQEESEINSERYYKRRQEEIEKLKEANEELKDSFEEIALSIGRLADTGRISFEEMIRLLFELNNILSTINSGGFRSLLENLIPSFIGEIQGDTDTNAAIRQVAQGA